MQGRSIWGVVVAIVIVALVMLGIGLDLGRNTQLGKHVPSFYEAIKDFQTLIAALIALAAAIYAAVPVWQQLSEVSLQSAVQSRALLKARADGASDVVRELHTIFKQCEDGYKFKDTNAAKTFVVTATKYLDNLYIVYLSDPTLDPLIDVAHEGFKNLGEKLVSEEVTIREVHEKNAQGRDLFHAVMAVPKDVEGNVHTLLGEFIHLLNRLRKRIVDLDNLIVTPRTEGREEKKPNI